jgi:hypothetical protein
MGSFMTTQVFMRIALASVVALFCAHASAAVASMEKPLKPSALPTEIAALGEKLLPHLSGKKCVLAPFVGAAEGPAAKIECELIVHYYLREELTKRGVTLLSNAPVREKAASGGVRSTPRAIKAVAELCGAEVVVTGTCRLAAKSSIVVTLSGSDGKSIDKWTVTVPGPDIRHSDIVPALNVKVVEWAESQIGKKVYRGECVDLAAGALGANNATFGTMYEWGRLLGATDAIMPGDIVQCEGAVLANGVTIAHHTMMIHKVIAGRQVEVLHQNWDGGAETGRRVKPQVFDLTAKSGQVLIYRPVPGE